MCTCALVVLLTITRKELFVWLYLCRLDAYLWVKVLPPPLNWIHVLKHPHVHPVQKHTNIGLCEVQTLQQSLVGIERYVLTHPCAPQACGYHKGVCHMCSRYIPALWCQFVHLTLGLQIHSSETPQLKATLITPPNASWSVSSFCPTVCNYVHIEDKLVKNVPLLRVFILQQDTAQEINLWLVRACKCGCSDAISLSLCQSVTK